MITIWASLLTALSPVRSPTYLSPKVSLVSQHASASRIVKYGESKNIWTFFHSFHMNLCSPKFSKFLIRQCLQWGCIEQSPSSSYCGNCCSFCNQSLSAAGRRRNHNGWSSQKCFYRQSLPKPQKIPVKRLIKRTTRLSWFKIPAARVCDEAVTITLRISVSNHFVQRRNRIMPIQCLGDGSEPGICQCESRKLKRAHPHRSLHLRTL